MSKIATYLYGPEDKRKAIAWITNAPKGCYVMLKEPKRSSEQNDLMWSLLTQVSKQAKHMGVNYTTTQWKCLFMHALGQEVEFLPALDGTTFVPIGYQSSELTKAEMTELIESIFAWGATHGVVFREQQDAV